MTGWLTLNTHFRTDNSKYENNLSNRHWQFHGRHIPVSAFLIRPEQAINHFPFWDTYRKYTCMLFHRRGVWPQRER